MVVEILSGTMKIVGNLELPENAKSLLIVVSNENNDLICQSLVLKNTAYLGVGIGEEWKYDETSIERLIAVTKWVGTQDKLKNLKIGYLGRGAGVPTVLSAAAFWGTKIKCVVCLGGKPDLALDVLDLIESPTLVIGSAKSAYQKIAAVKKLETLESNSSQEAEAVMAWLEKFL